MKCAACVVHGATVDHMGMVLVERCVQVVHGLYIPYSRVRLLHGVLGGFGREGKGAIFRTGGRAFI